MDQTRNDPHHGWIGVDLDGTLAVYEGWRGVDHIGEPVWPMMERVKAWIAEGVEVRIFTARIDHPDVAMATRAKSAIRDWLRPHLGIHMSLSIKITNVKDRRMIELWDDRVVQVEKNTGRIISALRNGDITP